MKTSRRPGNSLNLGMLKVRSDTILLLLVFSGIFASHQARSDCRNPESSFEQKDCDYQSYLKLQSELDITHRIFVEKFLGQVTESGGDTKVAKMKLAQAHAAWKKYVRTNCGLILILSPGNNAGQNQLACEVEHIQQQIKALKDYEF